MKAENGQIFSREMVEMMFENWYYIVFFALVVLVCVYGCMTGKVKEWLKYAVAVAEKELGSGTGQLKLRQVYDMFIAQFPVFARIVPFAIFSKWVDLSLEWLRIQLESNSNMKSLMEE